MGAGLGEGVVGFRHALLFGRRVQAAGEVAKNASETVIDFFCFLANKEQASQWIAEERRDLFLCTHSI